jgi:hypothetical protein
MLTFPPGPTLRVVGDGDVAVSTRSVQGRHSDGSAVAEETELGIVAIGHETPSGVAEPFIVFHAKVLEHFEEGAVRGFDGEVEAQGFEEDVFFVHDAVAPTPEVFALLVDEEVRIFLRGAAEGEDHLFHFATALFDFCGEE